MVVGLLICSACLLGSLIILIPLTALKLSNKPASNEDEIQQRGGAFELRKPEWREPPPPYEEVAHGNS